MQWRSSGLHLCGGAATLVGAFGRYGRAGGGPEVRRRGAPPLEFAQAFIEMKWPHAAAKSRDSMPDALATVLPALTKDRAGRPDARELRTALHKLLLLPEDKRPTVPQQHTAAVAWMKAASLDLASLEEAKTVRLALHALTLCLDGKAAASTTIAASVPSSTPSWSTR
jgi:hypothetical protein